MNRTKTARTQITKEQAEEVVRLFEEALAEGYKFRKGEMPNAVSRVAKVMNIARSTVGNRLDRAKELYGLVPDTTIQKKLPAASEPVSDTPPSTDDLRAVLSKGRKTVAQIIEATKFKTVGEVLDAIEQLSRQGVNILRSGEHWAIDKDIQPARGSREPLRYYSRPDNTYVFGAFGDQHIGSVHARYDVMEDLYDRYAKAGVDRVFNTGNWIDGDCRFNKFEVECQGIDRQVKLMAERFPKREGIETFAVWGDDHEGWYAQREGLDVGRYAQNIMHAEGRTDWHDLGYMEAHVELININTGAKAILAVVHPGGGSAYALSYSIQKIVESYEGGEKPDVGLYGHYHKLWAGIIRNVWVAQTGCGQDQTTFMRKKRLEAQVGGILMSLEQDPRTGAILACTPQIVRYFNKEWYKGAGLANRRWGYSGAVEQMPRGVDGIR